MLRSFSVIQFFTILLLFISCSTSSNYSVPDLTNLDLQGHRGARGLFPENTLPAFKAAMDYGMTTIELDTVLTKDKQLIIHHDETLNPKICKWSDGSKVEQIPIKNFTVAQLKGLDCGSIKNETFPEQQTLPGTQLATLKEFFEFVKDYERKNNIKNSFLFNIETKLNPNNFTDEEVSEYANIMVKTIEDAKVTKQSTVQSFVLNILPEIKKRNSEIQTSALFAPTVWDFILLKLNFSSPGEKIIRKAKEVKAEKISPYYEYVNFHFVKESKKNKLQVIPWTINEKVLIKKMILFGVDGIISDFPDRLKSVLDEEKKMYIKN